MAHKTNQPRAGIAICLLTVFCLSHPALAFDRTIQQYVHTAWGEKDGAPSGILALAQTSDGYLWIGSVDGLYRFDGVTFELYKPGLVYALLSTANGDLWIGRFGEITVLRGRTETIYTVRDGVPNGKVAGFCQDSEGTVWVATDQGLARLDGDHWTKTGREWNFPGKIATGMCLDRNGTFWVATESTIVFLPRGARNFRETGISSGQVWMIVEAPNGKLWMAETTRSVRPVPLANSLKPSDRTEIIQGSIGILFDEDGALWITTVGNGMRRMSYPEKLGGRKYEARDAAIEAFTSKDGLTDDVVTAILEDHEHNIWVSTNNGLDCFRKGALVRVVSSRPVLQPIFGVGDNGEMWIASEDQIIRTRGSGEPIITRTTDRYLSTFRDQGGAIWWSENGSVLRVKGGQQLRIPPKGTKAPFALLPHVTEDDNGVLWAAVQRDGFFYLENDVWKRFETPPEVARLMPSAAFTDWMDRVWFGFDGGGALVVLEHGQLHVLAASGESPVGRVVNAITGRGQHVWIGGSSLVYFDGSKFHPLVPYDANEFKVAGLEETVDGSLWLSEWRGVVHVPASEVKKFLQNYSYRVRYELFDSSDGLPGSFHDAASWMTEAQGTDGRLWFGATKGIAWLDPAMIPRNTLPPPVSIRSMDSDGKHYEPTHPVLPPRPGTVRIAYSALSLSIPSRVRFRYKLEGIDPDWQDPGTRREAYYTRPGPGNYIFRVIACNNDGIWNETGTSLAFSILPAYYETTWFQIVCVAAGLMLLWAIYQLRIRQLQRQYAIGLEARVNERTRIARELHDTLLQTFSASLLRFQSVLKMLPSRPEEAKQRVENAIEQASAAIAEGRDAVHQLRVSGLASGDLAESIKNFLSELIGSSGGENPPELRVHVEGTPRDLNPAVRDEVYRIVAEALRNAIRHATATKIEVDIRYDEQQLRLRVRDDGKGIKSSVLEIGNVPGHWGLHGMRERAKLLEGNLELWSEVNSGTEVELTLPAAKAYSKPTSRWSILAGRWRN